MIQKRTSIWHCLWGLPFLLIGVGLFVHTLFHELGHLTDSLTQVVVPGRAELSLQRRRSYTVFLEEQSVVGGKIYSTTQSIAGLECRVRSLQNGSTIPIGKSTMNTSYSVDGRDGHAVLEFLIKEDGKYEFACDYGENTKEPEVVVAVGSGISETIFRTVLEALGEFFGGIGASLIVVIVVLVKREHEKRGIAELGHTQV